MLVQLYRMKVSYSSTPLLYTGVITLLLQVLDLHNIIVR